MHSWRAFWFLLALGAGWGLELVHVDSFHSLTSIDQLASLSLPARVSIVGPLTSPHRSGPALVFTLPEYSLTCYFRHPPRELIVFPGDIYSIRARIEPTPTGKLCVVEELRSHVDP